jgi:PAS domain S-box-containing protein
MTAPVLVVEDNPITRKMIRVALSSEGYTVLEAPDGQTALVLMAQHAPALVLQDLLLPDRDGFDLVQQLRALPGGASVPILAISGFLLQADQVRGQRVGFTDYLFKPVEPSHLVSVVHAYLRPDSIAQGKPGAGHRVLVADDDQVQLKLLRVQLEHLGFEVLTAQNGTDALEQASRCSPDAIVSDVLMPEMDGFRLCMAVRQNPGLVNIPIVLTSAVYTEEADRCLAEKAGADAFTLRTPDHRATVEALLSRLDSRHEHVVEREGVRESTLMDRSLRGDAAELPLEDYKHRVIRQLEHQVGLSANLTRRLALLEAELGILGRILETLKDTPTAEVVLKELLYRCLDAAGISRGAAYLLGPEGQLTLEVRLGYPDALIQPLTAFFGHANLLRRVLERGEPIEVSAERPGVERSERSELTLGERSLREEDQELLAKAGARSILIAPLLWGEKRLGVLEMASANQALGEDWIAFAKVIGSQIGQALELARTIAELNASEQRYRHLVQGLDAIVWEADARTGRFTFVSRSAERYFGYPVARWLAEPGFRDHLLYPDDRTSTVAHYRELARGERSQRGEGHDQALEYRMVAADDRVLWFHDTVSVVREAAGQVRQLRGVMVDVTHRRQVEEQATKMRLAREIYQRLFPSAAPQVAGLEIGGVSYPAEATGGDYFDYFLLPDGSLAVVVGDATGHGFGPAILMAETRAYLRAFAQTSTDIADILVRLDRAVTESIAENHFVTLLLARLEPQSQRLSYVSAGHIMGYVLTTAGTVKATLASTGRPLGIDTEQTVHSIQTVDLSPGDMVVLLTDGIIEARSPEGTFFGAQRAFDIIRAYRGESAESLMANLYHAVRAFSHNLPQQDDISGVVLKVSAT